jgi:hypothetical protein
MRYQRKMDGMIRKWISVGVWDSSIPLLVIEYLNANAIDHDEQMVI